MCLEPSWKCSSQKSLPRTIVSFFLLEHFWLCFCLSPRVILMRTGAEKPTSSSPTPTPLQGKHRQQRLLWRGPREPPPGWSQRMGLALWPFLICQCPCPRHRSLPSTSSLPFIHSPLSFLPSPASGYFDHWGPPASVTATCDVPLPYWLLPLSLCKAVLGPARLLRKPPQVVWPPGCALSLALSASLPLSSP